VLKDVLMADQILDWLERAHHPGDIYELLGRQRFDPNVAALRTAVSEATREILPYQGHSDSSKAQRAMRLLTDLGGADTVLADADRIKKHDLQILDYLFDEYSADNGPDPQKWDHKQLRQWLAKTWDVHPDSLAKVVEQLCPPSADAAQSTPGGQPGNRQARGRGTGRKSKSGKKRGRRNVDQMFEEIGVQPRSGRPPRSGGGRRQAAAADRSSRRRPSSQTPVLAYAVGGGGVLLLIVAFVMFWPRGDRTGECVLIVDPVEAKVKVDREDVTTSGSGERRSVVIADAEAVKADETVLITVESKGYHPREIRWTPKVGQSSEIKVQLFRDFDDKK